MITCKRAILALCGLALGVTACAPSGPPPALIKRAERALLDAPGEAQPSTIVATEIAYAKAAVRDGQWSAAADFAASGARLHIDEGPVDAATWLRGRTNPAIAKGWATRSVVMSCDGSVAATQGRFKDADGFVGTYLAIWLRQNDGTYRWVYDVSGRDNPQPIPEVPEELPEGAIIVQAIDTISGLVADCVRGAREVPPPPAISLSVEGEQGASLSRDGTLRWRWEHRDDGTKFISVAFYSGGKWKTALEESL